MGKNIISGYALLYGSLYDMGGYSERIAAGALNGVSFSECRFLFNHDINYLLGSVKAGTLTLKADSRGLWYRCELPDTAIGNEIATLVSRGDLNQASWGFSLSASKGKEWSADGTILTIKQVKKLFDCSVVTFPANPATTVSLEGPLFKSSSTMPERTVEYSMEADQDQRDFERRERIMQETFAALEAAKDDEDFKRREDSHKHMLREISALKTQKELEWHAETRKIDWNSPAELEKHRKRELAYFKSLKN